ncbi:hypothetical protein Tco_0060757 [Tanacetum coccineum]
MEETGMHKVGDMQLGNAEKKWNAAGNKDLMSSGSFISSAFSSLIDIAHTPLENSYDVELADGKIVGGIEPLVFALPNEVTTGRESRFDPLSSCSKAQVLDICKGQGQITKAIGTVRTTGNTQVKMDNIMMDFITKLPKSSQVTPMNIQHSAATQIWGCYNVFANFKKKLCGVQLERLFWEAAGTTVESIFYNNMDQIKAIIPEAYTYLVEMNPNSWSRAFFDLNSKCASFENGIAESFNRATIVQRTKPIITMLEDIRIYIMQRLVEMNKKAMNLEDRITPSIRKRFKILKE